MPIYQLRFFIETPLRGDEDTQFIYRGHTMTFLFQSGNNTPKGIEVELRCSGADYSDAARLASNEIIPPVLDAIAFHRKTQVLLGGCRRILKAEPGVARRKLIYVEPHRYPTTPQFHGHWTKQIQQIIDSDPTNRKFALRWLRNSYRPLGIPERFIYVWLALENLAGEIEKKPKCSNCHKDMPAYMAADRDRAYEILSTYIPTLDQGTFMRWWTKTRNSLFHGLREPDAAMMDELGTVATTVQQALESHLQNELGVKEKSTAAQPLGPDRSYLLWLFLEFDAPNPADEFPHAVPQPNRLSELIESNRSVEEEMGCRTLGQKHFEGW